MSSKLIADVAIGCGHRGVNLIESNEKIVEATLAILKPGDILVTMGAGNIWQYGEEILAFLKKSIDRNAKAKNSSNLSS